ncbi:MAG: hypothetical protein IPP74_09110 [Alphaproteobacteria bacterium]|nr:hypothetical protein [Alphaproteobacteria bacterium]
MSKFLIKLGVVVAYLPLGMILTDFLRPLWLWVEESFGIKSMGTEYPVAWCYLLTYLALAGIFYLVITRFNKTV